MKQWSVENSVDNLFRGSLDIHNSNPGEELNFHGYPNSTSEYFGDNFGYPGCFAIYDTSNVQNYPGGAQVGLQMTGTALNSPDIGRSDEQCRDEHTAPRVTFGSHLAPLDIKFKPGGEGSHAYIAFHGSW